MPRVRASRRDDLRLREAAQQRAAVALPAVASAEEDLDHPPASKHENRPRADALETQRVHYSIAKAINKNQRYVIPVTTLEKS